MCLTTPKDLCPRSPSHDGHRARGGVWHVGELDRIRAALTPDATQAAAAFVERIRAEEREACAKVADELALKQGLYDPGQSRQAQYIAATIRARGKDGGT